MKALISPNEQTIDCNGLIGQRVAQVEVFAFGVAEPLYWIDCPDNCQADQWYYIDGELKPLPQPNTDAEA